MANPVLYKSAIICGFFHILSIIYFGGKPLMNGVYVCGVGTSIWNHGVTNDLVKRIDRIVIFFGIFVDTYYIMTSPVVMATVTFNILTTTILSYLRAKLTKGVHSDGNPYHLTSHVLATCLHVILLSIHS